jgi:hypothetical protein
MVMKKLAAVLVALVIVALPAMASAQGGSGIDEYTEDVPGGGGGTPSNDGNGGGAPLPGASQDALQEQGTDGAAAAELAESTGPGNGSGGGGGEGGGTGSDSGSGPAGSPTNPASTGGGDSSGSGIDDVVVELAGGSEDGMGILLPIILGSVLVAAVAFVLIRRGGGSPGSA